MEDVARRYDFVDSPFLWIPRSPLIERQQLQLLDEMQLREACTVLCEMISRGEKAVALKPASRKPGAKHPVWPEDEIVKDRLQRLLGRPVSEVSADAASNCRSLSSSKYDSGISMGSPKSPDVANPAEGVLDAITEFDFQGTEATSHSRQEISALNPDCRHSTVGLLTAANLSRLNKMISPDLIDKPPDGTKDHVPSIMDNLWRGLDAECSVKQLQSTVLATNTSFSRPSSSSPRSSKDLAYGPEISPKIFERETITPISRPRTQQTRQDPIRLDSSQKESGTLDGPQASHQDSVAVVNGTDGMEQRMTLSEQKERHLDLRRAVMEKMLTGTITHNSNNPTTVTLSSDEPNSKVLIPPNDAYSTQLQDKQLQASHRKSATDKSSMNAAENVSLRKKPSIIRKLSVLGFNKQKTSTLHNNPRMTGLTRVAEVP